MIHPGDTLENPVTRETLIFHRTSRETDGESVLVETIVRPDGFVAAAHVHPYQTERFEVLEGKLGLRVGDEELMASPGEVAVVEPGTPHRFWNADDEEARFLCEVRPALRFESLIETMFTLAAEDKTNRKGMPNPLRLAVIATAHFDTVRLPFPPAALQRAGLALAAPSASCSAIPRRSRGRRPRRRRSVPTRGRRGRMTAGGRTTGRAHARPVEGDPDEKHACTPGRVLSYVVAPRRVDRSHRRLAELLRASACGSAHAERSAGLC